MKAIRGAHTAIANTAEAIRSCTLELLQAILAENQIQAEDIVNATFTATKDLDAAYPAKFARELPGWDQVPLFCVQEMCVEGSLPACIRVMLLTEQDKTTQVKHVYLGGATVLRPDLQK
jgi:chorismate mutase